MQALMQIVCAFEQVMLLLRLTRSLKLLLRGCLLAADALPLEVLRAQ